jgi:hypothetical protein
MTPARLHVLTARRCSAAVVLRRGPSGQVAAIGWDRDTGRLSDAHWLRGRIYEYRADLSPDGRHMVYFAGKGGRWWTALSRAPGLTAIALWPQADTWGGGGAFDFDGRLWISAGTPKDLPDGLEAASPRAFQHSTDGLWMGGTHFKGLALRGWSHDSGQAYGARLSRPATGGWRLCQGFRTGAANRSILSPVFALQPPGGGPTQPQPEWEWADMWNAWVQFAAKGALWQAELDAAGLGTPTLIADLNEMRPDWPALPPKEGRAPCP